MSTSYPTPPFSAQNATLDGYQKPLSSFYSAHRGDTISLGRNIRNEINGVFTMSTAPTASEITEKIIDDLDQLINLYPTEGKESDKGTINCR